MGGMGGRDCFFKLGEGMIRVWEGWYVGGGRLGQGLGRFGCGWGRIRSGFGKIGMWVGEGCDIDLVFTL
jgi:hypothetical protein